MNINYGVGLILNPSDLVPYPFKRGYVDRSIGPDKPHPGQLEVGRVHIVSNIYVIRFDGR